MSLTIQQESTLENLWADFQSAYEHGNLIQALRIWNVAEDLGYGHIFKKGHEKMFWDNTWKQALMPLEQ